MVGEADGHRRRLALSASAGWSAGIPSAVGRQWSDPLSRGGLALLVSAGLTGVLGFVCWIIAARFFSTYAVGVTGALVTATTFFSRRRATQPVRNAYEGWWRGCT